MFWLFYISLYKMLLVLIRNSLRLLIISNKNNSSLDLIFWYHFVKQIIFLKNKFEFGRFILKILCGTYVWPDLHPIKHLDRRVKKKPKAMKTIFINAFQLAYLTKEIYFYYYIFLCKNSTIATRYWDELERWSWWSNFYFGLIWMYQDLS